MSERPKALCVDFDAVADMIVATNEAKPTKDLILDRMNECAAALLRRPYADRAGTFGFTVVRSGTRRNPVMVATLAPWYAAEKLGVTIKDDSE